MKKAKALILLLLAAGLGCGCKSPLLAGAGNRGLGATLILSVIGARASQGSAKTIVPQVSGLVVKYSAKLKKGAASQTLNGQRKARG